MPNQPNQPNPPKKGEERDPSKRKDQPETEREPARQPQTQRPRTDPQRGGQGREGTEMERDRDRGGG